MCIMHPKTSNFNFQLEYKHHSLSFQVSSKVLFYNDTKLITFIILWLMHYYKFIRGGKQDV